MQWGSIKVHLSDSRDFRFEDHAKRDDRFLPSRSLNEQCRRSELDLLLGKTPRQKPALNVIFGRNFQCKAVGVYFLDQLRTNTEYPTQICTNTLPMRPALVAVPFQPLCCHFRPLCLVESCSLRRYYSCHRGTASAIVVRPCRIRQVISKKKIVPNVHGSWAVCVET